MRFFRIQTRRARAIFVLTFHHPLFSFVLRLS